MRAPAYPLARGLRRRRAHRGDPAADPPPAPCRLRKQPDVARSTSWRRRSSAGARRFVNFSSETVPGFIFAYRPFEPDYLPVDEEHPVRPQDPYATAKWFGELLMERALERADIATHLDPPLLGAGRESYARNLGPIVRDPVRADRELLLLRRRLRPLRGDRPRDRVRPAGSRGLLRGFAGHDRRPSARGDRAPHYGGAEIEIRPLARDDASAISVRRPSGCSGWEPSRSWRDYLDDDGRLEA